MQLARSRPLFFLAFIACALVIGIALFLEHEAGLTPCALCILQRTCVVTFGVISLIAYLHAPGKLAWQIYSSMLLLIALAGAMIAGRQVWLQTIPAQDSMSCLPGFEYLFEIMSISQALSRLFESGVNCDEVTWTLFEMSVPEWSLLAFVGLIVFATYQLFQREPASVDHE